MDNAMISTYRNGNIDIAELVKDESALLSGDNEFIKTFLDEILLVSLKIFFDKTKK
jgi:hypothetical protein